ncbi:MAG: DNA mismatch repair endonuclease MutL [Candidatus Zixiibacteriota bacterium]
MQNNIILLPEELVDKIAAGEVVERPASVVKELVENSIDAGAKNISVEIKNGGVKFIRVTDDGVGMNERNAELAFQRHATSKIKALDDLFRISSLGFRGEAMPSIASVSYLEMLTRTREDSSGTDIKMEGGIIQEKKPTGSPLGTSLVVRELFYNVPARRKFLKTMLTETRHIIDLLTKFSIAYPEISFKLDSDGRELFAFPAVDSTDERIWDVFGKDQKERMVKIREGEDKIVISGFLGKPEIAPSHRAKLYVFVNRRPITSRSLYHAVQSGYGDLLPRGKYPLAVIFIRIDPGSVDVNVHPSKSEVRFANEKEVHDLVYARIKESLTSPLTIPEIEVKDKAMGIPLSRSSQQTGVSSKRTEEPLKGEPPQGLGLIKGKEMEKRAVEESDQKSLFAAIIGKKEPGGTGADSEINRNATPHELSTEGVKSNFWQFADTYILSQLKDNLLVLDQHAAHERILYEEALRNMTQKPATSQQVLFPAVTDLTPGELHLLDEHEELIRRLGFEIKNFGGRTVLVTAVPPGARNKSGEIFLKEVLFQLEMEEKIEKDKVKALAKSFACHAAIKAGERLNQEEMENLVRKIFTTEEPYSCPHGRPTIIKLTLDELNKKFGRN